MSTHEKPPHDEPATSAIPTGRAVYRSHPKILFAPALVQLLLAAAHVIVAMHLGTVIEFAGLAGTVVSEWGAVVVHALIIVIEVWYVVVPIVRWRLATFVLTPTSVEVHEGIIWRNTREIPLERVTSIHTERGLLDRIFGCGTLAFFDAAYTPTSQGAPDAGVRFHDVPRVAHVRARVDEARAAAQAFRGDHA